MISKKDQKQKQHGVIHDLYKDDICAANSPFSSAQLLTKYRVSYASEAAQKTLLLSVADFAKNLYQLVDILPEIGRQVIEQCNWPGCVFDYLPSNSEEDNFRANWQYLPHLIATNTLKEKIEGESGSELIDAVAVEVLRTGEAICVDNLLDFASKELLPVLVENGIGKVMAFPVLANGHTTGILYFLVSENYHEHEQYISIIEKATEQIGLIVESRIQSGALERNYTQLRGVVNKLHEAQDQLIQSDRLASLGQLSAGIAHEINNPVGFVKSNMESLQNYFETFAAVYCDYEELLQAVLASQDNALSSVAKEIKIRREAHDIDFILNDFNDLLNESVKGLTRVINITQGLQNFARENSVYREPCCIKSCVKEVLKLATNELKYKVNIHESYACDTKILANEGQIVQVILNIIVNASQSIEGHGDVFISTETDDGQLCLKIRDTGSGIPEDIIDSIFNPFFTTKSVSQGTGLGLSISYGIVASHSGVITVDSELGKGTEFTIWLPIQ